MSAVADWPKPMVLLSRQQETFPHPPAPSQCGHCDGCAISIAADFDLQPWSASLAELSSRLQREYAGSKYDSTRRFVSRSYLR